MADKKKIFKGKYENVVLLTWSFLLIISCYISTAYTHKSLTIQLSDISLMTYIPMTPLLLYFGLTIYYLVYYYIYGYAEGDFRDNLLFSLVINGFSFGPMIITYYLLVFYEISVYYTFLSGWIFPFFIFFITIYVEFISKYRKNAINNQFQIKLPYIIKLSGYYLIHVIVGFFTIFFVGYIYSNITNISYEIFLKENPSIIFLSGAALAGVSVALTKQSETKK
jgi:uncharacterized Tic20 family protein